MSIELAPVSQALVETFAIAFGSGFDRMECGAATIQKMRVDLFRLPAFSADRVADGEEIQ
ncbi:MAG: hypothetical protein QOD93_3501 [Acetobacteraceae bacterium]|jgi:hypothetical protein|nr:hypothetical protein [Rhodopila sp.]MEA2770539.1 hypothetical protein [Acetobacteraceae bacterium]